MLGYHDRYHALLYESKNHLILFAGLLGRDGVFARPSLYVLAQWAWERIYDFRFSFNPAFPRWPEIELR